MKSQTDTPFSLFTAYQILRSERENCLDFLSAILKCRIEKQNCTLKCLWEVNRQWIWLIWEAMLNHLWKNKLVHGYIVLKKIKMWSAQNTAFDHIFDHLQTRTTWKQCSQEHPKAPFLDTKAPKITRNYTKNLCSCVRDTAFTRPNIFP